MVFLPAVKRDGSPGGIEDPPAFSNTSVAACAGIAADGNTPRAAAAARSAAGVVPTVPALAAKRGPAVPAGATREADSGIRNEHDGRGAGDRAARAVEDGTAFTGAALAASASRAAAGPAVSCSPAVACAGADPVAAGPSDGVAAGAAGAAKLAARLVRVERGRGALDESLCRR